VGFGLSNNTSPFSLSFTNSLSIISLPALEDLSTFYLTLYTVIQELEDSLQLPKYIPSLFPSIIIKFIRLIPLLNFRKNKIFGATVQNLVARDLHTPGQK
jgi:hypothetical protein